MLTLQYLILAVDIFRFTYAAFTDLENFVRVIGSLDSEQTVVNYLNGSVFGKQPGKNLQKLFNVEGYNINRNIRNPDGTYETLSREFIVYRQPNTSQILQVWLNPWTNKVNEVFYVANDPVNGHISTVPPSKEVPCFKPLYLVYNVDCVIEYPNPLSPDLYDNYSAGLTYNAVDLFSYFGNYKELKFSKDQSVSMIGTWIRKSQYLPWMEMSTRPGGLYYNTMFWKCNEGLSCVADDIMQLIEKYYPKFEDAPTKKEVPNETSWTVFKKVIDQRREAGLPDIIIPEVNTTSSLRNMTYNVDERVFNILYTRPLKLAVNGSVCSEIPGNESVCFLNIIGTIEFGLERLPAYDGYRVHMYGYLSYYDPKTGQALTNNFTNPITGQINKLPNPNSGTNYIFENDSFYTIDIPLSEHVGLLGTQSVEWGSANRSHWYVNFIDFIFPYKELKKIHPKRVHFFGTFAQFASWPTWMEMGDIPGNIFVKLTISK